MHIHIYIYTHIYTYYKYKNNNIANKFNLYILFHNVLEQVIIQFIFKFCTVEKTLFAYYGYYHHHYDHRCSGTFCLCTDSNVLPKVHKQSLPLRSIISANGTFCHATAKYFAQLLAPLAYNKYTVKNTFSFVSSIKSLKLSSCYMISFDVETLFTSVTLHETINIILDQIYTKNAINTSIPESDMRALLTLCTDNSYFTIGDEIYAHIDGVAMGSPLGPVFAYIFLAIHEQRLLQNNKIQGLIKMVPVC